MDLLNLERLADVRAPRPPPRLPRIEWCQWETHYCVKTDAADKADGGQIFTQAALISRRPLTAYCE
jgi:hypothetical protein